MKKEWKMKTGAFLMMGVLLCGMLLPGTAYAAPKEENAVEAEQTGEKADSAAQTEGEADSAVEAEQTFSAEEAEKATREDNLQAVLAMNPEDAGEPELEKPVFDETTYTEDVFFPQTTLHGIFSSSELFFYMPDYWETKYVYVELEYSVSQLVQSIASSMTFSVNNVPVSS